ncbi:MAG: hypothetical protein KJ062_21065 [Thermoanaerobaculia bacterium]|nr:hypothetical protein [Thermoanaerobaculia bacterium]
MIYTDFSTFREALIGEWVGTRNGVTFERERVRSRWRNTLEGRFLHEDWFTAGTGDCAVPTAEALFSIADSGPGDFVAAYTSGRIAFGESAFADSAWTLTHRWLRESGIAVVRLRFLDANTYEQEVAEVTSDGRHRFESIAVLQRERELSGA